MHLSDIVTHLNSLGIQTEVLGEHSVEVSQIASLKAADSSNISFLSDKRRVNELKGTQAGVVLIKSEHAEHTKATRILVDDPYYAYAVVAQQLNPVFKELEGIL